MKKGSLILLLLFSLVWMNFIDVKPDTSNSVSENIAAAIRNGNSKQLAVYFFSTIELSLPGKDGTFSKVQAEMILKDFFSKNPAKSFEINQKGNSAGGSQFIIGTYKSPVKIFKVYILLKSYEGQLLIRQFEIEDL